MTQTVDHAVPPQTQKKQSVPLRLEFLDGIRGFAAFYVVLFHAYAEMEDFDAAQYPHWLRLILNPLNCGHYAVGVFIVLSGYCLMLPVVRSADKTLKGGFKSYITRRAKRILPPYYAALAVTLLFLLLVPAAQTSKDTGWAGNEQVFHSSIIPAHLLVVQNLNNDWAHTIDSPMWSVATEWQIYFIFALFLLPVWRRLGNLGMLGFAILLGLAITMAAPKLEFACFWYIGLFAFGMAASTRLGKTGDAELRRWGITAFIAAALLIVLSIVTHLQKIIIPADFITGIFAASLIIYCAGHAQKGTGNIILRVFESKAALTLGMFSYSLYLIHYPVITTLHMATNALHLSLMSKLFVSLTLGPLLSVAAGYLFFVLVERHFVHSHTRIAAKL